MRLWCLGLAAVIALTSLQMAVTRGMEVDAAGQFVICTGQGVKTITVDRDGQPVEVVHICPDCALTFAGILPAVQRYVGPHVYLRNARYSIGNVAASGARPLIWRARGPPRSV